MGLLSLNILYSQAAVITPDLFSSSVPPKDGYVPNLGNGWLGFDCGCQNEDESSSAGYIFAAGTFNGMGSQSPSRRALIPQKHSIYVASATFNDEPLDFHSFTATLDLVNATFRNTSSFTHTGQEHGEAVCQISITNFIQGDKGFVCVRHRYCCFIFSWL